MRIGIIVTDFPKVTETFILRDLIEFDKRGHEVRIYHLTAFRGKEVVHDFARPALNWARPSRYFFSWKVVRALVRATRYPVVLAGILGQLIASCYKDPLLLAKSAFILPKCLGIAEDLADWRADHVHAEFASHPATCAWIVRRITGLPYSVSCHAHDIFVTQALLGPTLSEASFVRAISDFNRRFLIEHVPGLEHQLITVIHIGIDTAAVPALEPPSKNEFRILYVGSLEKRKGVDVLLRALSEVNGVGPWRCEVVGGGPERGPLEGLVRRLKLGDRITFHGARPFETVKQILEESHVLVVPSIIGPGGRTEGIPTVLIEALAHQRPVIASQLSGIPELVQHSQTGLLVPPGDPSALARALEQIFSDPDSAYQMAQNGRRTVEAEFDLHKNVDAQLAAFAGYDESVNADSEEAA